GRRGVRRTGPRPPGRGCADRCRGCSRGAPVLGVRRSGATEPHRAGERGASRPQGALAGFEGLAARVTGPSGNILNRSRTLMGNPCWPLAVQQSAPVWRSGAVGAAREHRRAPPLRQTGAASKTAGGGGGIGRTRLPPPASGKSVVGAQIGRAHV